jgi:hypothetical protein
MIPAYLSSILRRNNTTLTLLAMVVRSNAVRSRQGAPNVDGPDDDRIRNAMDLHVMSKPLRPDPCAVGRVRAALTIRSSNGRTLATMAAMQSA